jgi:hypothetical protein
MEAIFEFLNQKYYHNTLENWLISFGIIIVSIFLARATYWLLGTIVKSFTSRTKTNLDDLVVDKLEKPAVMLIITMGIRYGLERLHFAEGFDAIFYNACHADTEELDLTNELFRQVREQGMPILFFHCAMHNFRKTSSQPGLLDRLSLRKLKQWWSQQFPSLDFPVWWQLTGIDSTSHAFPQKLVLEKEATRHPITEQLPQVWASPRDELYLSHKELDDIQVLYRSINLPSLDHVLLDLHELLESPVKI